MIGGGGEASVDNEPDDAAQFLGGARVPVVAVAALGVCDVVCELLGRLCASLW